MPRRWTALVFALIFGGLASVIGGCDDAPCETLCERERAQGCAVLTYVQLPCEEQCRGVRELAEGSGCVAELEAYYACAVDQDEVCGEAFIAACAAEDQAYAACRTVPE